MSGSQALLRAVTATLVLAFFLRTQAMAVMESE